MSNELTDQERISRLEFLVARLVDMNFALVNDIRNAYQYGPISQEGKVALTEVIMHRRELGVEKVDLG